MTDTDRTLGKFHQAADAIDLDLVVPRTGHGPEVVHLVVEAYVFVSTVSLFQN